MCVAVLAWRADPRWELVVLANRDEYHERPTAPLARWNNGILAGTDRRAGGTWLGVTQSARFALVTNHRVEGYPKPDRLTRGRLVTGWLEGGEPGDTAAMNPFNLFVIGDGTLRFLTNWPETENRKLPQGIHGLSNGPFDHPWPKAVRLCAALTHWLGTDSADTQGLFAALRDPTSREAVDTRHTDPEPRLSGVFIADPVYGTRSSTIVLVDREGAGRIVERCFDAAARLVGETALDFRWSAP